MASLDELKTAIPNIAVFIVLAITLLGVLTYFQFIQCSQVPGWCQVYCSAMGKSRVAIVYGSEGLGDPQALRSQIVNQRYTPVEMIQVETLSAGLLKKYDLVIVERAKNVTLGQADALNEYLLSGKPLIWIGDSGTQYYLTDTERTLALQRNATQPGYYEALLKQLNSTKGFGKITSALGAQYVQNRPSGTVNLLLVDKEHAIVRGLSANITLPVSGYASVSFDPATALKVADLKAGSTLQPGLLESRYAGKVLYIAFPLEEMAQAGYTSFLDNVMSYLAACG